MSTELQPKIKHSGKLFQFNNGGGGPMYGYVPVPEDSTKDGTPWINWRGSKMPHHWWLKMLAFFQWTYDSGKDESLVYFYYNDETKEWIVWAPPQRGFGMTVKRITEHPNNSQEEAFRGFVRVGTGHHHCAMKAFASGTDNSDEEHFNGIHITIGELDKTILDLHSRAIFNGNKFECDMSYWVEMAPRYAEQAEFLSKNPELEEHAYFYSLQCAAPANHPFPDEWKANFNAGKATSFLGQGMVGNGNSGHISIVQHQNQHHYSRHWQVQDAEKFNMINAHPRALELKAGSTYMRYCEIERHNVAWPLFTPDSPGAQGYCLGFTRNIANGHVWVGFEQAIKEMKSFLSTVKDGGVDATKPVTSLNNAEKGEADVLELRIPLIELQLTVENMAEAQAGVNKTNLDDNKNVIALKQILQKWGLNIAWLVKLADRMEQAGLQSDMDAERSTWPYGQSMGA